MHKLFLVVLCWLLCGVRLTVAQGTAVVFNTGNGQPLITQVRAVTIGTNFSQPRLFFDFGFATDEIFVPGMTMDSFTVTLQDSNQVFTAIYLTIDASGAIWAPVTPGTLFIDPAAISTRSIAYPNLDPVLASRQAYEISVPIPGQFAGNTVNVFFDLFDNLNPINSQAWFSSLAVIPEPSVWALGLLAAWCAWSFRGGKK